MAEISWKEQYNHPLWQKKRLEALEAEGFKCSSCGTDQVQLHVHHKRYVRGRKIWEYTLEELSVLCAPCHEAHHSMKDQIADLFLQVPVEHHGELLQLCRGYVNNSIGPYFHDRDQYVRLEDQFHYVLGELAGTMDRFAPQTVADVARQFAARVRDRFPKATTLARDLDSAGEWLEAYGKELDGA